MTSPIYTQAYSQDAPPRQSYFQTTGGTMTSKIMIGVDVAKHELVIDSGQTIISLANHPSAIDTWLNSLPTGSYIALEATGAYHQLMVNSAIAKGMVVYLLNPRDLCHYAQGLGRRSKTDRVDAQLIRRFLINEQPYLRAYPVPTEIEYQLALLQRRRATLVKHRQALQKSLADVHELQAGLTDITHTLNQCLATIDQQIKTLVATQPQLQQHSKRLETIPGIGRQTAVQLAVLFSRVKLTHSDAAVAFVGLDPRAFDSGLKKGRRRLSKRGSSELRRLLYNCAQAAVRTALWKPFYATLKARDFKTTQALVIIARKLLRIAFSIWKQEGMMFDAQKVLCLNNFSCVEP
jgi:transposase